MKIENCNYILAKMFQILLLIFYYLDYSKSFVEYYILILLNIEDFHIEIAPNWKSFSKIQMDNIKKDDSMTLIHKWHIPNFKYLYLNYIFFSSYHFCTYIYSCSIVGLNFFKKLIRFVFIIQNLLIWFYYLLLLKYFLVWYYNEQYFLNYNEIKDKLFDRIFDKWNLLKMLFFVCLISAHFS
jgi:hypothetical protein